MSHSRCRNDFIRKHPINGTDSGLIIQSSYAMKNNMLYFVTLFLLMLVTGVFWGTWFTLTRSLESFSSDEFTHIGKVIIANVAWPMRILMPATILGMILSLLFYDTKRSVPFYQGVISFVLLIIALVITVGTLVPMDNQIKDWTSATVPQDWERLRDKWKTFHAIRTFASLASFACFTVFVLRARKRAQ